MILEKIRSATSSVHKELEESSWMKHFSDRTITRPVYTKILNRLYGYFHPLERTLNRYNEITAYLPDYQQRRRSVTISEDLRKINGPYTEPESWPHLPGSDSAGKAFGCLYVMEGSTLRGKIISGILQAKLGITYTTGAAFFHGLRQGHRREMENIRECAQLVQHTV